MVTMDKSISEESSLKPGYFAEIANKNGKLVGRPIVLI